VTYYFIGYSNEYDDEKYRKNFKQDVVPVVFSKVYAHSAIDSYQQVYEDGLMPRKKDERVATEIDDWSPLVT
jgi:hypothetical protein